MGLKPRRTVVDLKQKVFATNALLDLCGISENSLVSSKWGTSSGCKARAAQHRASPPEAPSWQIKFMLTRQIIEEKAFSSNLRKSMDNVCEPLEVLFLYKCPFAGDVCMSNISLLTFAAMCHKA